VSKEVLRPEGRPPTPGHAPGVVGAGLVFVAGQVARDTTGATVGATVRAQAEQIFHNIGVILGAAGAGFDDIVKTTIYMVDPEDFPQYAEVRDRYLGPNQASTLVYVNRLVDSDWLIEVDAIAVRPGAAGS
jgi:enamine deaminase RidA (YjgF/YER057c/UK114 family)